MKNVLQEAKLVVRSKARGKHRKKRERKPLPGMMVHQDASTHEWVPEQIWDLVVTLDDATSEHTSMFFCDRGGHRLQFSRYRADDCAPRECFAACTPIGAAIIFTPRRRRQSR